jgi:hypothetical protein
MDSLFLIYKVYFKSYRRKVAFVQVLKMEKGDSRKIGRLGISWAKAVLYQYIWCSSITGFAFLLTGRQTMERSDFVILEKYNKFLRLDNL